MTTTLPDRLVLGAGVLLSGVVFLPAAADPVNPVKLTLLIWAAIALIALSAVRGILDRRVHLPAGLPAVAGLLLFGALTCAAAAAPVHTIAVVGTYGRNSGYLAYTAGLVLFLAGLVVFQRTTLAVLSMSLLLAAGFTATYGLMQRAGHDAIHWSNPFNPIIASLGNPDFASAYLGLCTPLAVWPVLRRSLPVWWRVSGAALAMLLLGTAVLTDAIQGPIAAAAGAAVLLLAFALDLRARSRYLSLAAGAALVITTGAVGALGLRGIGPGASALSGSTFQARSWYWQAALRMFKAHPYTGVGLDAYGTYFRQFRPIAAVVRFGGNEFSDAAHSVPLQMAAQGGAVLAAAYLVFVGTIFAVLARGLWQLRGEDRLQLGAFGGAWVASQVQSWVSIDQVPLIAAQYALAAAVVVASGKGRTLMLPPMTSAPTTPSRPKRGPRHPPAPRRVTAEMRAELAAVAVAALVLAWFAGKPLRADMLVRAADEARVQGSVAVAQSRFQAATRLMPGVSLYWARLAGFENSLGHTREALQAYALATNHDRYDVDSWRNEGRLAEAVGDLRVARYSFARATVLDPTNEATILDQATFELRHGGGQRARQSLTRAVGLLPQSAGLWASLGDAQAVTGDPRKARESYARALTLQAGEPTATKGLVKLDPPHG